MGLVHVTCVSKMCCYYYDYCYDYYYYYYY